MWKKERERERERERLNKESCYYYGCYTIVVVVEKANDIC
jgi:hypothetical protein